MARRHTPSPDPNGEPPRKGKLNRDGFLQFGRIAPYLRPHRIKFAVGIVLITLSGVLTLLVTRLWGQLGGVGVDPTAGGGMDLPLPFDTSDLQHIGLAIFGVLVLQSGLSFIRIWLFGGTTRFDRPPGHPASDAQAALGGPAASFVLAASFFGMALVSGLHTGVAFLAPMLLLLGVANALGAALNLLPAFPLDGGRVLRAALWRAGGSRARATRLAARSGGVFGIAAALCGLIVVLRDSPVGWGLVAMGWFVAESAGHAEDVARIEEETERLAARAAAEIEAVRREAAPGPPASSVRLTRAGTYEPASRTGSLQAKRPRRKRAQIPAQPPSTPKSPPVQGAAATDEDSSKSSKRPGSE